MATLGIVLVVLAALMGAVGAVARDRHFTARELVVQLSWTLGFVGVSILLLLGLLDALEAGDLVVALGLWLVWVIGGIVILARDLKARLDRAKR